jgi:hypothetical protein
MMQNVDKYGKVDVERNKQIILDRRAKFKGDPFELSKATRQDPLNEREAFMIDAMNCRFNPILLGDRISDLSFTDTKYKVGNFYWENGLYSTVKFVENPNGRVMILEHPTTPNQVTERGNYYFPNNRENYCMGSDSFDHKLLTKSSERSFSLGSFTVLKKPDPLNPTPLDYAVVCFYLHRPDSPDIYYDDNLMAAWYYGCENLIETQKIGIIKHYETLRCDGFVPYFVNNRRGIPATRESNEYIGVITDQYINNYIDRVFFIQLCKQWERFKPEDTTEFDGAMSFGYAYMLLKNDYKKLQQSVQPQATEIGDILSLYRSRSFTKNYRGF